MHLTKLWEIWRTVAIVLCLAQLGHSSVSIQQTKQQAKIVGELVVHVPKEAPFPEIADKTLPDSDFPLYLFSWEDSIAIRDWIKRMKQDEEKFKDLDDTDRAWIYEKRVDDLYLMITTSTPLGTKRTDKNGRFIFEDVKVGERFFIIGAQLLHAYGIVWTYKSVGPTKPGVNRIRLENQW